MIILAIDSGFDRTGYSVFDKNKKFPDNFKYVTSGLIQTNKKTKIEQRLREIHVKVSQLIKKYQPNVLVLEQLFFFKNQKTFINVANAQGVVMLLAAENNINLQFLTPLQIKSIITGYGQADKIAVQKMLQLILKFEKPITQDDEADAIACGLAYCYLNKF